MKRELKEIRDIHILINPIKVTQHVPMKRELKVVKVKAISNGKQLHSMSQ